MSSAEYGAKKNEAVAGGGGGRLAKTDCSFRSGTIDSGAGAGAGSVAAGAAATVEGCSRAEAEYDCSACLGTTTSTGSGT